MPFLEQVATGRNNNLNLLRVVAASAVLFSHSHRLALGPTATEPLTDVIGDSLGTAALYVFFTISGFLVTQSFERSQTVSRWTAARMLRLFPALFVVLVLTVTILGPAVTTLSFSEYATDPRTATYVFRNLTLAWLQPDLPGVFEQNPYGGMINGPLWTLFYEVICYAGVLVAGLLGVFALRQRMAAALFAYFAVYLTANVLAEEVDVPGRLLNLLELSLPFAVGSAFYVWRSTLPLSWTAGVVLAIVAVLARPFPVFHEIFVLTLCYWVFLVAYLPGGFILRYNAVGDFSYGIYICAFPMQQLAAHLLSPMTPLQNAAIAAPATLALAMLSWHLVEKPALASKARVGAALARGTRRFSFRTQR